jgi:hypothetical protein
MLLPAVLGLAGALWAADPRVGTWKLNIAQSKIPPGSEAAPKEETATIRELGDQYEITIKGTRTDGASISLKVTQPQTGGAMKRQPALPEGESGVSTEINPGEWYATFLQNGKQVEMIHTVVGKDGKTMRLMIRGTDARGKSYEGMELFDRQ